MPNILCSFKSLMNLQTAFCKQQQISDVIAHEYSLYNRLIRTRIKPVCLKPGTECLHAGCLPGSFRFVCTTGEQADVQIDTHTDGRHIRESQRERERQIERKSKGQRDTERGKERKTDIKTNIGRERMTQFQTRLILTTIGVIPGGLGGRDLPRFL